MRTLRAALCMTLFVVCVTGLAFASGTKEGTGGSASSLPSYLVAKKPGPYVIGVSNAFVGNSFRVEEIAEVQYAAEEMKSKGILKDVIIASATGDTAMQIQQIQNLIAKGVDAILVDANSDTALNPAIEAAHRAGILVVAFDDAVTSPYAINVTVDQKKFGSLSAEWLAKKLNGKGNIIVLNGLAGSPINAERWVRGGKPVLDKYPDIKVLTTINANWDQATAQAAVANILPSFPKIDGIWSQGGAMTLGAIYDFQAAGRPLVPMTGESNNGFLKVWKKLRDSGDKTFDSIAPGQPAMSVAALQDAVKALQGEAVPQNDILPLVLIGSADLDKYVLPDLPDSVWLPTTLTNDQLKTLFGAGQ